MLAQVAKGKIDGPVANVKKLLGTDTTTSPTRNWKIWMTEFNVLQHQNGQLAVLQDMGHALVIADWTGMMLEQNVERMFIHSLDHNPYFALVQYANLGGSTDQPRVTVPGYAFGIYAQEFGATMLPTAISNNPTLQAPSSTTYPQLSVYSSIANNELRVMMVNRDLTERAVVDIDTENVAGRKWLANGKFKFMQLRAARITDGNNDNDAFGRPQPTDFVKWSEKVEYDQHSWGLQNIELAPASVNFFIIPLQ